ncbi:MAG: flagellar basal body-associated FliL family protein [Desulfobacterota bacterium]|nr:flagellar basal body-associated FliL family protein [Thermodesulfobacteriota bacterium]
MADEKADEKKEQQAPETEKKKKSPLLLVIIIAVAGLVIGGGGVVTYMLLKGKPTASKQEPVAGKELGEKKEAGGHGGKQEKQKGESTIKNIEPSFIVNLAGPTRSYLKVDMALELSEKKVEAEIESKLPMIKDAIVLVLSEQTPDSIADNRGKLQLKDQLLRRINNHLTSGKVVNIYFTSFVVQ